MERVTIKAIHTDEEHRDAVDAVSRIMDLTDPDEADLAMLETLAVLVRHYEERTFPLERPTAVDAIRFRMDQLGINQAELAKRTGFPKSRISDLLNLKRAPSLEMIRSLHEILDIPSDILIGRSKPATAS